MIYWSTTRKESFERYMDIVKAIDYQKDNRGDRNEFLENREIEQDNELNILGEVLYFKYYTVLD